MSDKKKILVVDDDKFLAGALSKRLEDNGFEVESAGDAYAAVALAQKEGADLFILDINLPAGGGFSIHERLGRIDKLATVPVIYLTGEKSNDVRQLAEQMKAFAIIYKPYDFDQVLATVKKALSTQAKAA